MATRTTPTEEQSLLPPLSRPAHTRGFFAPSTRLLVDLIVLSVGVTLTSVVEDFLPVIITSPS